jgi:uncharacterized protein (DUF2237 family)
LTLVLGAVALLGAFVALATHHHTANAHARGAGEGVVALSAASAARLGVENDASSGSKNLLGGPLRPCSDATQATQTGIDRSGSCAWDPDDAGYHAVCVKMDAKFLSASATRDANDLSSVVKPGERWCVCAWAFASAVERDPKTMEGLELQCDGSNGKLRGVYESFIARKEALKSPSGREYEAGKALAAVTTIATAVTNERMYYIPTPRREPTETDRSTAKTHHTICDQRYTFAARSSRFIFRESRLFTPSATSRSRFTVRICAIFVFKMPK